MKICNNFINDYKSRFSTIITIKSCSSLYKSPLNPMTPPLHHHQNPIGFPYESLFITIKPIEIPRKTRNPRFSHGFPMVFRGLKVKSHDFYTGGRAFWELPKDLQEDYAEVGDSTLGSEAETHRKMVVNHSKTMGNWWFNHYLYELWIMGCFFWE